MSRPLALVADIGGTNARFALTDLATPTVELQHARALRNADFASVQHAVEHYIAEVGIRPDRAALAVASPVGQDEIRLTNRAWSFSRSELQRTLGLDELRMLNDFGAIAWAVPSLDAEARVTLHGDADAPLQGPVSVLGPGTGLGVALLVGSQAHGWHAVETEGGHVSFAPLGDEERAIDAWLTAQPRPEKAISSILSPLTRTSIRTSSPQSGLTSSYEKSFGSSVPLWRGLR